MAEAPAAPATLPAKRRIGALDAVRGVAILAVIATHSLTATVAVTDSYSMPPQVLKAFDFGQFGVQLFFVLSGWLIFSLYWGDRPFTQAVYWSRRWARIWPLWVIFLAVSFIVYGVPDTGYPWFVAFVVGALFLGWLSPVLVAIPLGGLTIQQEMGHYLLFSLFRRRSGLFLACTVIAGYLSMIAAQGLLVLVGHDSAAGWALDAWLRLSLFNSWPFFLLGGAGYITFTRWRRGGVTDLFPQRSWTTAAILVALALSMLTSYSEAEIPGYFVLGYVVLLVGIALAGNSLPVHRIRPAEHRPVLLLHVLLPLLGAALDRGRLRRPGPAQRRHDVAGREPGAAAGHPRDHHGGVVGGRLRVLAPVREARAGRRAPPGAGA